MATKRKTTSKAKAPKVEPQSIGFFPIATQTLNPKAAAKWLEQDAELFHELVQEALQVADRREREALAWFAYYLGQVVQGAARAVALGKPVRLRCDRDPSAIESLALVLRAASRISSEGSPEELEVLAPVFHTIAARIVCLAREAVAASREAEGRAA
jgi:hypothetical protein